MTEIRRTSTISDGVRSPQLGAKILSQFASKWVSDRRQGLGERVRDAVRPAGPLKPRLEEAVRQIRVQVGKLDQTCVKLKDRDNTIFTRVVSSIQKHDMSHATIYANELAEVRKMNKMVTQAKLALEQISLRLNTVSELGDVVVTLAPAMGVIKNVQAGVMSIIPEAENEISEISGLLSGILVDAGQMGGYTLNFKAANEDAEKILGEASTVAEARMKEKFPSLPSSIPVGDPIAEGM